MAKSKKLERIVRFSAGHDCMRFECKLKSPRCMPGGGGSHSVHGVDAKFFVKGADGAVQFVLFTGWLPRASKQDEYGWESIGGALPADLGYHSKKPRYDGQTSIKEACEFCDGKPCYYDGSGLNAYGAMHALVNGGDAALWAFLEEYYAHVFHGKPYPKPVEYPTPLRK